MALASGPLATASTGVRVAARDIGKTYWLGERLRLGTTIGRLLRRPGQTRVLHALDSVSFDAREGECFGIVGTNGSGKSTILQILAGITPPTNGRMDVRGRVLPLLAVGAGFQHELTGRENAVLYGTILGLRRDIIDGRIDDIAAFAELERHFDTPLKRYSSGMMARLSFAIAMEFPAHIYCFDEVLAVVDGEFRERCLGQIRGFAAGGHTVMFISHDLDQVEQLCDRVLWMERGRVRELGGAPQVLERYAEHLHEQAIR